MERIANPLFVGSNPTGDSSSCLNANKKIDNNMSKDKEYKYVRINVIFNNSTFQSMWLELSDDETHEIILQISEFGTSKLESLKVPITESRFIIISREQLDMSLLELEFSNRRTKTSSEPTVTMING